MSNVTLEQALRQARAYHQAGQLSQAEALCRQILATLPRQPDALHLLGVIALQTKHLNAALDLISQAIASYAANPAFYLSLGEVYQALEQDDDAAASFGRALKIDPGCAPAHFLLGALHQRHSRLDKASACYQKALALDPNYAQAHSSLGAVLFDQGQLSKAAACFGRALAIQPAFAQAHYNLGVVLVAQNQPEAAIACFQKAVGIQPYHVDAWNNLGAAFVSCGRLDEAIPCLERAIALWPHSAEAHNNLGAAFSAKDQLDKAGACYQQAVALQPDHPAAYEGLGNALFKGGRIAPAIECFRQVARLLPKDPMMQSDLIYTMLFKPNVTAQERYAEYQEWNRRYAVPLRSAIRPCANTPDSDKRLKIGYVSPDFRTHVCGLNLISLFEAHDHAQVNVYCYASVRQPDAITERLKQGADVWRDVVGLSDEELAEQIQKDGIDILLDLTMHMANNRLPVFARKPAPVQVSWLAYPDTTGLGTIDYRLTDAFLEPPQRHEILSSVQVGGEQAIRLTSFWCYNPLTDDLAVNDLPALGDQPITFGCLNNFCKINEPVLELWARVLKEVPQSRLLILAEPGNHRDRTRKHLQKHSSVGQQVQFVTNCPRPQYLALYHRVDIMLDTFPYNGHTTSLDALWMGVPVVTLAGETTVGRGGVSILSNVGLPELIARSEDEYVRIAVELASDLPRLAELRATMRARMLASPLMDGPRFARSIEAAYRHMWTNWCQGQGKEAGKEVVP